MKKNRGKIVEWGEGAERKCGYAYSADEPINGKVVVTVEYGKPKLLIDPEKIRVIGFID